MEARRGATADGSFRGIASEVHVTTRDALHQLVDELTEEQAEMAQVWLQDLRDDAEALASLDRGLADVAAGRVKSLADYERERGL